MQTLMSRRWYIFTLPRNDPDDMHGLAIAAFWQTCMTGQHDPMGRTCAASMSCVCSLLPEFSTAWLQLKEITLCCTSAARINLVKPPLTCQPVLLLLLMPRCRVTMCIGLRS